MAIDFDDEILQDFLVEAGEIIDLLDGQLVDLESNPDDVELLNAIFRGFHTVKGGAGFLGIEPLVILCHRAEDVFNLLRQRDLKVTQKLMDVVLKVHDTLRQMFKSINDGMEPEPAEPELIHDLEGFLVASDNEVNDEVHNDIQQPSDVSLTEEHLEIDGYNESSPEDQAQNQNEGEISENITDDEFEDLLDKLHGGGAPTAVEKNTNDASSLEEGVPSIVDGEDITDDEFEELLDKLHGGGAPKAITDKTEVMSASETVVDSSPDSENITDDEFENLLNELHGNSAPGNSKVVKTQDSAKHNDSSESVQPAVDTASDEMAGIELPDKASNNGSTTNELSSVKTSPVKDVDKSAKQQETTVRVDTGRLDDIMNLVGELVLVRNRLANLEASVANEDMSVAVSNLDLVTSDLQAAVMKTRMQPIKKVFGRFPRVVRDLSRNLGKDVELILVGEETDLDKNLVEALADPLIHLVRNSVDHGIEMPDVRLSHGKSKKGTITLSARQEGENILLSIEDDGAGIDPTVIKNIAINKGVIDADSAVRLSDEECYSLIFMPGFSTKEAISDISGRGVGMDVVKTKITQLNGAIRVTSELGKGTKIEIKVPLTLAIMPTLMVKISDQIYALPLTSVVEIFNFDEKLKKTVDGQEVLLIRDKALPIYHLDRWLSNGNNEGNEKRVVVVNSASKEFGFVVDSLLGQEEVVIKPLGALLHGTRGMSGATITGDGKISLILDVPGLMHTYANGL